MTTRASILALFLCVVALLQPAISEWQQTFSEEFTTLKQLNSSTWIPAFHWQPDPSPNGELQTYRPDAFNFSSTTSLGMKAWKNLASGEYYSSVISTKDRFVQFFGYFEFRARLPTAKGVMASFNLIRQDTTLANQGISIKVVLSNPRRVYFTQQCGSSTNQTSALFQNITDLNMHKFGIEWSTSVINFFVDDVLISSQSTCVIVNPMYIASHLVVGGNLAGDPDASTPFPVTMDLDYIRAYSKSFMSGFNLTGPGPGIMNQYYIMILPRIVVSNPSLSNGVVQVGQTTSFSIVAEGGGFIEESEQFKLINGVFDVSLYHLESTVLVSRVRRENVTLYTTPGIPTTLNANFNLQGVTEGFYRVAIDVYEANLTKIFTLNTVSIVQVAPPLAAPLSPPVTPPVSSVVTSNVVPILDCYAPINTTHYRAYFSYENKNNVAVSLPVGNSNKITPGSMDRGQPTVFTTGRSALFPNSVFTTDVTNNIEWVLSSYTVDVDITDTSSLCQSSVTIVIVVSSPTPINDTKVNQLKDVIASQLNVTSDDVQISVTCTTSTNCEISVTISADPSQVSDLIQKAKEYATDPATVENTVKQVSTDLSVTEVRGTKTNTEKQGTSNPMPMTQPISSNAVKTGIPLIVTFAMLVSLYVM